MTDLHYASDATPSTFTCPCVFMELGAIYVLNGLTDAVLGGADELLKLAFYTEVQCVVH